MNEVEFRAWDKRQKKMYEVFKIFFSVGNSAYVAVIGDDLQCEERDDSNSALLLYTGRKDKNGVKIFSSHICKVFVNGEWKIGVARYAEDLWGYYLDDGSTEDIEWDLKSEIEIIGNEFENPELLPKSHD